MRLTLIALLCAAPLCAADIYVATTGVDSPGGGTLAAPYATLAYAHSQCVDGDKLVLRGGTYTGGVYMTRNNFTVESYTGEWAIVSLPTATSGQDVSLYFAGTNCTARRLELVGGYFYAIKIDAGPALVEDCRIHDTGRDCVKIPAADNVTIRRCEIYNSGVRDPSNAEGIDNVNGDTMLVQDCYIHDIATNGLYPKGGSIGSIIERCLIRNCGGDGISMAQSSGTAFYDTVANPEYYGCRDCIARNNIIENCQGSGIDLEAALRAKVYNNTLINVANTSRGGIRFAASSFGGSPPDRPCTDCEIINNIIVLSNATARPMLFMGANSHTGTLTMSNNRYFKTGGTAVYWWEPTGQYGLNLSGWQTSSGTDTNSTEGDPQVGADWHLLAGSPCISAAMTLAGFTDDYDGNTRGGAWDIGPDQTGAAPIQTPPPTGTLGTGGGFGATLSITTSALPDGVRGDPYVATITCTGGSGPYTWSLSSGNLPLGLALDTSSTSNSTTITGTPYGEGGRTTFSVTVTGGGSITRSFTISIPGHGAGGCGGTCNCTGNECSVIGWYGVIAMIAATLAWRRKRRIARR